MDEEILKKYGVDIEKYRKEVLLYKEREGSLKLAREKERDYDGKWTIFLPWMLPVIFSIVFGSHFFGADNARILFMLFLFFGWIPGAFFWNLWEHSDSVIKKKWQLKENLQAAQNLYDETESKLNETEKIPRDQIHNNLEAFYQNRLFNKRSANPIFRESLAEFAALLDEYKKIHFKTTPLYLNGYQSYVDKRSGEYDRNTLVQSKELDSARALSEGMSKVKEVEVKETDGIKSEVAPIQKPPLDQALIAKQAILEYVQSEESSGAVTPKIQLRTPEKFFSRPRRVDWNSLNATRKENGNVGELLVVDIERNYLINRGRSDLAKRIRHVSQEADGHGYDIQSFFTDGQEKYIEVKSTSATTSRTFQLSKNEFEFLQTHQNNAYVYHVLNVASEHQSTVRVYPSQDVLNSPNISPSGYVVEM